MTREEAYNRIDAIIARHEIDDDYVTITSVLDYDALRLARKLLEQKPKTGHWIKGLHGFKCSKCLIVHSRTSIYCPSCGAKMIE